MLFDTPVYFIFLTAVVVLYWRLKWRAQNGALLAASYFFYGWWDWRFLLLMMVSTVADYFIAAKISDTVDSRRRRVLLTLSLVMNFGFLGFFKYCNFFVESFANLIAVLGVHNIPVGMLQIILPPGISFYTFQEVAYIVDVYHRKQEPARSLVDYALFISLFPHLIAGPIQRPSHLLPQVQNPRLFNDRRFFEGLMLIASGLFRKCVIADHCALLANAAFQGALGHNCFTVLIGAYAFAWQIYGDFSGYSDLARGSAQLLGFHFMVNFRQPYFSGTLQEFWRRWHISLSTWLRDYLYVPLGGSRRGTLRTYVNLMVTMLLGGLWHGANWTFVIWGGLHGGFLAFERWMSERAGMPQRFHFTWRVLTLGIVGLAWIFFRARSVNEAVYLLGGLGYFSWDPRYGIALLFLAVVSGAMMLVDWQLERSDKEFVFQDARSWQLIAVATAFALAIAFFGATEPNAFIYFQF